MSTMREDVVTQRKRNIDCDICITLFEVNMRNLLLGAFFFQVKTVICAKQLGMIDYFETTSQAIEVSGQVIKLYWWNG